MNLLPALAVCACLLLPTLAAAAEFSPVGLWKNVDDESGKTRALIRIVETAGELQGTIERVFPGQNENPNPVCTQCPAPHKGKPIVGLTIISGMKKNGSEYSSGQILDPGNGKTYRSLLEIIDSGQKLKVRGYIGIPALGRTQIWLREE